MLKKGYFQIEDFLTSNLTFDLDFLLAIGLVHLPFLFLKCFARSEERPNFLFSSIWIKSQLNVDRIRQSNYAQEIHIHQVQNI